MKKHNSNFTDIPLGISMAVAQNPFVYKIFSDLTPRQREDLISNTRPNADNISSEIGSDIKSRASYSRRNRDFYN